MTRISQILCLLICSALILPASAEITFEREGIHIFKFFEGDDAHSAEAQEGQPVRSTNVRTVVGETSFGTRVRSEYYRKLLWSPNNRRISKLIETPEFLLGIQLNGKVLVQSKNDKSVYRSFNFGSETKITDMIYNDGYPRSLVFLVESPIGVSLKTLMLDDYVKGTATSEQIAQIKPIYSNLLDEERKFLSSFAASLGFGAGVYGVFQLIETFTGLNIPAEVETLVPTALVAFGATHSNKGILEFVDKPINALARRLRTLRGKKLSLQSTKIQSDLNIALDDTFEQIDGKPYVGLVDRNTGEIHYMDMSYPYKRLVLNRRGGKACKAVTSGGHGAGK